LVEGEIVPPVLILDKHTFTVTHSDYTAGEAQQLKLSAKATLLFGQQTNSSNSDSSSSLCRRLVSMQNPLETAMVVNVSVDGPFLLQEVVDVTAGEVPSSGINPIIHKNKTSKKSASSNDKVAVTTNVSMMTGKTFHLLPHVSHLLHTIIYVTTLISHGFYAAINQVHGFLPSQATAKGESHLLLQRGTGRSRQHNRQAN